MDEQRHHQTGSSINDDRDRMLNQKLDRLEYENQILQKQVTALETTINVVKLEQSHLKELFDARFKIIEAAHMAQLNKLEQMSKEIQTMASDVDNSPATRALQVQVNEIRDRVVMIEEILKELRDWKNQVDGALFFLKFATGGSLLALVLAVVKILTGS